MGLVFSLDEKQFVEVKMSEVRFFEFFAGIDEFFQYFAVGFVEDVKEDNFIRTEGRNFAADKEKWYALSSLPHEHFGEAHLLNFHLISLKIVILAIRRLQMRFP